MAWPRFGVRARVQAAFALGGLLVSAFLAVVSWELTSSYLYSQREISATRNALISADLLARRIGEQGIPSQRALKESASRGHDAVYLPRGLRGGVAATPRVGSEDLPRALVELAASGAAAEQRLIIDDRPVLAVALPLPNEGVYVELFPLRVVDRTLRTLSVVLAATAALATLLSAGLGRWAARRTLRPLHEMVAVARDVAQGHLEVRLDAREDPDLKPLATAFNTTAAALQARVARDARFASDVGHELRSPLMTMLNAVELLDNRRAEMSPAALEALDLLAADLRRFQGLVDDLLEVSRDDQRRDVDRVPVRLGPLVRRVADSRAGRPVTHMAPDVEALLVEVDPRRLDRIVTNLVQNAEQHGGGIREVTVDRTGHNVRIMVHDCGPGVDPDDRERVFERFHRGPLSRARFPGSGLGLAIVAQHAHAQGGRVWVEDAEPHGAAFVVEFPIDAEERA